MQTGDIVTREHYHNDIQFVVEEIINDKARLSGLKYRILADAEVGDLMISNRMVETPSVHQCLLSHNSKKEIFPQETSYVKILHIDGNRYYLKECLALYKKLGISAIGYSIKEENQPRNLKNLLI